MLIAVSRFMSLITSLQAFIGNSKEIQNLLIFSIQNYLFGVAKSPCVFQALYSAVCRIMKLQNFSVIAYLDDFLIIESSYDKCKCALDKLLGVLRLLGFHINYNKIE